MEGREWIATLKRVVGGILSKKVRQSHEEVSQEDIWEKRVSGRLEWTVGQRSIVEHATLPLHSAKQCAGAQRVRTHPCSLGLQTGSH